MKHKWWHGFFTIWLGHREERTRANFYGAKEVITKDETSIFCPLCGRKIVYNNLAPSEES